MSQTFPKSELKNLTSCIGENDANFKIKALEDELLRMQTCYEQLQAEFSSALDSVDELRITLNNREEQIKGLEAEKIVACRTKKYA